MAEFKLPTTLQLTSAVRQAIQALKVYIDTYLPRGYVAGATATATSWTNATTTDSAITASTGSAPSITTALSTSRRYKAVFHGRFSSSVAGDAAICRFYENGVGEYAHIVDLRVANTGYSVHAERIFIPDSAASVVYAMFASRFAGTGTVSAVASSQTPIEFWIEDIGPA